MNSYVIRAPNPNVRFRNGRKLINFFPYASHIRKFFVPFSVVLSCMAFLSLLLHFGVLWWGNHAEKEPFYTAAVLEHARFEGWDHAPLLIVNTNLQVYREAARVAKSQGADILVFPEYAIFPIGTREQLRPCMENIPNPETVRSNPCLEPHYSDRHILTTLSCIARNNSIVVVANMGDVQDCKGQSDCRPDGVFFFNTNVVFDRDGSLLLKYHKETSYNETAMDRPKVVQYPVFETDFGTFATYACSDIQSKRVGEVFRISEADAVALPAMWNDEPPQVTAVQIFESWVRAYNGTLLAPNVNLPGKGAVGSGIFHYTGTLAYTYNPDGISKLVVARVPKKGQTLTSPFSKVTAITKNSTYPWEDDGVNVTKECSYLILGNYKDIYRDYRCFEEHVGNYTFVPLLQVNGSVTACNNGLCCSVEYATTGIEEDIYLGVFNGSQTEFDVTWCEESCVVTVCEPYGGKPCAVFPRRSRTVFQIIDLVGNFLSKPVLPTVIASDMRLVPFSEWRIEHSSTDLRENVRLWFENENGRRIISAGLKGLYC